jgi:hypothetical protein
LSCQSRTSRTRRVPVRPTPALVCTMVGFLPHSGPATAGASSRKSAGVQGVGDTVVWPGHVVEFVHG